MRRVIVFLLNAPALLPYTAGAQIIIDHRCKDLSQVPVSYVTLAKQQFRLSYGHSRRGSQIVSAAELPGPETMRLDISSG